MRTCIRTPLEGRLAGAFIRARVKYVPGETVALFGGWPFTPTRAEASPPVFLSPARFTGKKAPHLTLLAFERVAKEVPEARLLAIGIQQGLELGGGTARVAGGRRFVRPVGNLRRVGNPPATLAPVANRRAGCHPAPQSRRLPGTGPHIGKPDLQAGRLNRCRCD